MSFVIESWKDFVKGKNDLLSVNRNFILRDSNGKVEYLWSICQEHNAKRYEVTISSLT